MRVVIIGVTGFLGSSLAHDLRSWGHEVWGTTSRATRVAPAITLQRLGEPVDPGVYAGADVVIHAAHDLTPGSWERNVAGTVAIADTAMRLGVTKQVYISSYSAHPGAVTEYGLSKVELESYFLAKGHGVARPGLVIGRGGLFARLTEVVQSSVVVPVVYPSARVPLIGAADLLASIRTMIEQGWSGVARLYRDERVTMDQLIAAIRISLGSRTLLIPIPYRVALTAAVTCDRLGLPSPLSSDSVRALRANQAVIEAGDLARFVATPQELQEMIDAAR